MWAVGVGGGGEMQVIVRMANLTQPTSLLGQEIRAGFLSDLCSGT